MVAFSPPSASAEAPVGGPACEPIREGLLAEPVAAITSLAFVVAGAAILALGREGLTWRSSGRRGRYVVPSLVTYAVLVAAVGFGSVAQHGPNPPWADVAHDLPLLATLAFVGADSFAALTGRVRVWWWWTVPTIALLPLIVGVPPAGDLAQVGVAVVAVALTVVRAWTVPRIRRRVGWSLALLAVGGIVGTLARAGGPLCVPDSLWQGHAVWHVLASAALVVLAPVIGDRADDP